MQKKKNKKKWGLHNYNACKQLSKVKDFPDWIITTAFYSAIHFVDGKIFPIEIEAKTNITYTTFDSYYIQNKQFDKTTPIKHDFRLQLVKNHLPDNIASHFERLYNASDTARYRDYESFTFENAQKMFLDLEKIIEHCTAPIPKTKPSNP